MCVCVYICAVCTTGTEKEMYIFISTYKAGLKMNSAPAYESMLHHAWKHDGIGVCLHTCKHCEHVHQGAVSCIPNQKVRESHRGGKKIGGQKKIYIYKAAWL